MQSLKAFNFQQWIEDNRPTDGAIDATRVRPGYLADAGSLVGLREARGGQAHSIELRMRARQRGPRKGGHECDDDDR